MELDIWLGGQHPQPTVLEKHPSAQPQAARSTAGNSSHGELCVNRQAKALLVALCVLLLTDCAAMQGPPEDLLKRVPVVEIGQPEPADTHYVLFIRAGKPVPVHLTVKGPLFVQPGQATAQVKLSQSLYIYKEWSSLDGLNWTHQGFEGALSLGLAPKGGIVDIHVSRTQ